MSFSSLLIHTCDIGLLTQGIKDDYGTRAKTWPTTTYPNQPCRLVSTGGREVKVGAEVVISDWKLFVDNSVLVGEQDRVSDIRLASTGGVIDSSTFEIILVQMRSNGIGEHHKELALQKVK
ncbi:hypothetical protein ES703_47791 [subsurface metagenome]